jgi:hypothetical protein
MYVASANARVGHARGQERMINECRRTVPLRFGWGWRRGYGGSDTMSSDVFGFSDAGGGKE